MRPFVFAAALLAAACCLSRPAAAAGPAIAFEKGDKIVLIGNALAERENYFGHIEARLHARFPDKNLVVRNMAFPADEITLRLRSLDYADHGWTLKEQKPDVIFAFFGFNESFAGPAGLEKFKADLKSFLAGLKRLDYPYTTFAGSHGPGGKGGEGLEDAKPPRIVLFSPIPAANLGDANLPEAKTRNRNLAAYAQAMAEVAGRTDGVTFVDLYAATVKVLADRERSYMADGVHLNDVGYEKLARIIEANLFGPADGEPTGAPAALLAAVREKNLQHWYDYRAVNGYYIYGGRKNPFGVVNFPAEFAKLRNMVAVRDERIWKIAQGKTVPGKIDDSGTGAFVDVKSNVDRPIELLSPEKSLETFTVPRRLRGEPVRQRGRFPRAAQPLPDRLRRQGPALGLHDGVVPDVPAGAPGPRQALDPRRHRRRRQGGQEHRPSPTTFISRRAWNSCLTGLTSPSSRTSCSLRTPTATTRPTRRK